MAFTNDPTTRIGRVRLYGGDDEEATHVFEDEAVQAFIDDATGEVSADKAVVALAAYKLVLAKAAKLSAQPTSQSMSSYSESTDLNSLLRLAEVLRKNLDDMGISLDGNDVAQFGHAEVARGARSFRKIELKKSLRGESY